LILHPKGDCFTYFRRDGKKLRQMTKYAINNSLRMETGTQIGGPLDKLCLALQLYNTYVDEPVLAREEIYTGEKDPTTGLPINIVQKPAKHTKVTWPGEDNLQEFCWVDENGHTHLKSLDADLAEVILSQNCLHFRVIFLYLLPTKKQAWVDQP